MATVAELEFLVRLRDNATSAVNQIRSSFGGLSGAAGQASAAMARVQALGSGFGAGIATGAGAATQRIQGMAAALAQLIAGHNGAAGGANNHNNAMNQLHHTIGRTVAAFGDLVAANALASGGLGAYREFEKNMSVVERITENSAAATLDFNQRFIELTRSIQAVPVDRLGVIAGQAAQLGIQGNANILKFTQTMGKLETILPELGDQAPKLIARLLAVSGEGVESVDKFGNMLIRAGKDASASEAAILHLTSVLAQSTAQFKLGSETLLGLGTSFAELGLQPELASTAVARSLAALNTASLNNTVGMRELTAVTGLSADAFQKLIRENPAEALLIFTDVLNDLNKNGQDTVSFLTQFQLQASETGRVLGTVSQNSGMVRQNIAAMRKEAANPTALNQEFSVSLRTLDRQIVSTQNAWRLAKTAFGEALAPAAIAAMQLLRSALDRVSDGFKALPRLAQQIVAWGAVSVPAILGVIMAFSALRTAMSLLGVTGILGAFTGLAGAALRFGATIALVAGRFALFSVAGTALTFLGSTIAAIVAAVGIIPITIGVAVAALVAGAAYVYTKWDEVKAFFETGFVDAIVTAFDAATGKMKALWDAFVATITFSKAPAETYGPQLPVDWKAPPKAAPSSGVVNDISKVSQLSLEFQKQIAQLDEQSKILDDIKKKQAALDALRTLKPTDSNYRSADEQARLQGLLDLEKLRADAVGMRLKALREATQTAMAYTAAEKNSLEVVTNIREELEKRGALTQKQIDDITKQTQALQAARQNTAFRELVQSLSDAAGQSRAVTREQQLQVEITQKIADGIRNGTIATKEQAAAVRNSMQQTAQNNNLKGLMDKVQPQTAAIRDYESDVRVLNEGLKQGSITAAQYQAALAQLNRSTLEARDPWGAQVKSMKEAIGIAKITGDYMDADAATQTTINSLRDKGVQISKEQAKVLQEYNRAMDDVRASQSSGFEGWAKSVGSFRSGLLDVQRDFMSSLSTGIVGVLSGKGKAAVADMFAQMGQKMLTVATDQALKGIGEKLGFADLLGTGSKDALAKAQAANDNAVKLSSMTAQSVTVTSASVIINGQTLTGIGLDQAKTYVNNGTVSPYTGNTNPLFNTMPQVPGITAGPFVGGVRTPTVSGSGFDMATQLIKAKEGFRATPYWDVNAYRSGYGSDTMTDSAGRVSRVTQGSSTTIEDANRDLERRIGQFQETIKSQVTPDVFNKLAPQAQAGLTSVAYNYGRLPSRIVDDVKTGDTDRIATAVSALGTDNGGVNAKRRAEEAALIRSSNQQVQQAQETAQKVSDAQKAGGDQQVQAIATAQQQIQTTTQGTGQSMQQLGTSVQQAGDAAQQAAPKMQQVSQSAGAASVDSQQMAGGLGNLTGSFVAAQSGMSGFGSVFSTVLSSIFKSLSSVGSGGGGIGGFFSSLFGGGGATAAVAHSGWEVGVGTPMDGYRRLPAGAFANAKRLHSGTNDNEFKAILKKGEQVLTEEDKKRNKAVLGKIGSTEMKGGTNQRGGSVVNQTSNTFAPVGSPITFHASGDKKQDDESLTQLQKTLFEENEKFMASWVANQQRPGNMLANAGGKRR